MTEPCCNCFDSKKLKIQVKNDWMSERLIFSLSYDDEVISEDAITAYSINRLLKDDDR